MRSLRLRWPGAAALAFLLICLSEGPVAATSTEPRTFTFEQLGAHEPLALWGMQGGGEVGFSVRADELITSARVHLSYSWSPSLIPPLSQLRVLLNDHVVTTLPLPKAQAGNPVSADIDLDPRLIGDYNKLRFQLIGYYTEHCQDPTSPLLWVNISNLSDLELVVSPLKQVNDLASFPEPFFDRRDPSRLVLPFVLPAQADKDTLEAAAILSSWFGAQADWRGADFPVARDIQQVPSRYAVLISTDTQLSQYLPHYFEHHAQIQGPTVAVVSRPDDPAGKILLLLGRSTEELRQAAIALTVGGATLSGPQVTFRSIGKLKPRQPYDAPRWVRLDRPVTFGELTNDDDLQVKGHFPRPIDVDLRIPPDLFFWDSKGIPLDLKYRYSPPIDLDESRLSVFLNGSFIQTFNLFESGQGGIKQRVRLPVPGATLVGGNALLLPAYKIGMQNRLRFDYSFAYHKKGECRDTVIDNAHAAIDADSQIDFSQFPHYTAMPNLRFFVESGYPYTRMADLSETELVMDPRPSSQDLHLMLVLMGRMGQATGYPVTGLDISASVGGDGASKDIIVIGSRAARTVFEQWKLNPLHNVSPELSTYTDSLLPNAEPRSSFFRMGENTEPSTRVESAPSGPLGALISFESPIQAQRTVVVLTSNGPKGTRALGTALIDSTVRGQVHGSAAFLRGENVKSVDDVLVGDTYYVGKLPLWTRLWYTLSQHPLLLTVLALLTVLIVAFLLWGWLRARAARRLGSDEA